MRAGNIFRKKTFRVLILLKSLTWGKLICSSHKTSLTVVDYLPGKDMNIILVKNVSTLNCRSPPKTQSPSPIVLIGGR